MKSITVSLATAAMLFSGFAFPEKYEASWSNRDITLEKCEYSVIKWDPKYDYTHIEYNCYSDCSLNIKNIKTVSGEYYTYIIAENDTAWETELIAYTVDGECLSVYIKGPDEIYDPPQQLVTTVSTSGKPVCSTTAADTSFTTTASDVTSVCEVTTCSKESITTSTTSVMIFETDLSTNTHLTTELPLTTTSKTDPCAGSEVLLPPSVSTGDEPSMSDPGSEYPGSAWIIANDYGDVNSDGYIDINDLTVMSLALLKDLELSEAEYLAADVNFDYEVNVADLAVLLQYISKARVDIVLGPKFIVVYR